MTHHPAITAWLLAQRMGMDEAACDLLAAMEMRHSVECVGLADEEAQS